MPVGRPPLYKPTSTTMIDSPIQPQNVNVFEPQKSLSPQTVPLSEYENLKRRLEALEQKEKNISISPSDEWTEPTSRVHTALMRKYFVSNDKGFEYVINKEFSKFILNDKDEKITVFRLTLSDVKDNIRYIESTREDLVKNTAIEEVKLVSQDSKTITKVIGKTRRRTLSSDGRSMVEGEIVPLTITKKDVTYTALTESGKTFKTNDSPFNIH